MSIRLRSNLMLFLTAMIWGSSFAAQRAGMNYIGPFTFNSIRSFIGFLVLIPVILVMNYFNKKNTVNNTAKSLNGNNKIPDKKTLLKGGSMCGVFLFIGSSLQQHGLVYTTAGKAGFITALYIVLVPILGLFLKQKIRPILWLYVALATTGLYLLCIKEGFSIGKGDLLVLACAFIFAIHILVIDYFSQRTDGVKMSCIQFLVCSIISTPFMIIFETIDWINILNCWLPIIYAGAISCGVAYTLQIVSQKNTTPTVASLILSLESVFALIAGIIILREQISLREAAGCITMFAAIILAQLPSREEKSALVSRKN